MFSCDHLTHPFLNDPGTSQNNRVAADLLEGNAQIDNREISDILSYLAGLSRQINFYDESLAVTDWQPFFSGDLPFLLSGIAAYDLTAVKGRIASYSKMFRKNPGPEGLQLIFYYSYYAIIHPLHTWSAQLQQSGLDLEQKIQKLISDRLRSSIKSFIEWMNTAVSCFCIRPLVFNDLLDNSAWGLTATDLSSSVTEFSCTIKSTRSQLLSLFSSVSALLSNFTDVVEQITSGAADPVNQNLYSLLQTSGLQDTSPHLALLYSFLNQFLHVMDDMNNLTQKHLDFFFQNVLQLSPGATVPDKVHIIFGIQKKINSYPLPEDLSLKDGKDAKQSDIFFGLDSPVVITQTQATDIRTLFVNKETAGERSYIEGVYMAPDVTKSDGLSKPFKDPGNASWPTLGAKKSEYTPPGTDKPIDYPYARLGFILGSKILLMKEGTRKIHIQLACHWKDSCKTGLKFSNYFREIKKRICGKYLVITQDLIDQAKRMGVRERNVAKLKEYYLLDPCKKPLCGIQDIHYRQQAIIRFPCCDFKFVQPDRRENESEKYRDRKTGEYTRDEKIISRKEEISWRYEKEREMYCDEQSRAFWYEEMAKFEGLEEWEKDILRLVFKEQWVFDIYFSGEKNWIIPEKINEIDIESTDEIAGTFLLHIWTTIGSDQDAVSFYNKDKLGEDFNTTDPLVKIQLNEMIKIDLVNPIHSAEKNLKRYSDPVCCLERRVDYCGRTFSLYEFFRNVVVLKRAGKEDLDIRRPLEFDLNTKIQIRVCGVTSLIVQNDKNVLDANNSFTPFGVKPVVVDFDVLPFNKINSDWIDKNGKLFNLVGPNFYVGSTEIFLKKWDRACLNINWQSKPSDFKTYYQTYFDAGGGTIESFPDHQVGMSLLKDGTWYADNGTGIAHYSDQTPNGVFNRCLFSNEPGINACNSIPGFQYSFNLYPSDFGHDLHLKYDKDFNPLTKYSPGIQNGFICLTLEHADFLHQIYTQVYAIQMAKLANNPNGSAVPPNEPWTPTIQKGMSIDYEATAGIKDMNLIQLYPFDGTYLSVDIAGEPKLFAEFCDEGNLFVGLNGLMPGEQLNILFQLAEATADTEASAEKLNWQYLVNNQWQDLQSGFQIIEDATRGLTRTGIIQIHFPDDISGNNTIMPTGLYWIKASMSDYAEATSQTIAIITQAALTTFINNKKLNDQTRPATPLPKGSITKLTTADALVNLVNQPFDSFGGQAPEASNDSYYLRVSEQLRHKGRAIQKWDYERMVLQQFPKVIRVKCINHSYSLNSNLYKYDFPMSPGNVIVAVLPDINQLAVADSLHPTVPMSMLVDIENYLTASASPFVQIRVKNPRYEPVDICLNITLRNSTDYAFFESKLHDDIIHFMAPWQNGNSDDFQFAKRLYLSDLADFVNSQEYIGVLVSLRMCHDGDIMADTAPEYLEPLTPRSILVAGRVVVKVDQQKDDGLLWKKRLKINRGNVNR